MAREAVEVEHSPVEAVQEEEVVEEVLPEGPSVEVEQVEGGDSEKKRKEADSNK